jgi:hypothetical protein
VCADDGGTPPQHLVNYVNTDGTNDALDVWSQAVRETLVTEYGEQYVVLRKLSLVGIGLVVLVREEFRHFVKVTAQCDLGVGAFGMAGNKGACALSIVVDGPERSTFVCFVGAHLSAHQHEVHKRNQDVQQILDRVDFSTLSKRHSKLQILGEFDSSDERRPVSILGHDFCFFFGDLNYRVDADFPADIVRLLKLRDLGAVLERDQLQREMSLGRVFVEWEEGAIRFPPTYKFVAGTSRYKAEKRVPSFCDRVLYRGAGVACERYWASMSQLVSDHKPVSASFTLPVPVFDTRSSSPAARGVLGPSSRRLVFNSKRWRRALFDFTARHPDELSFRAGDVLELVQDVPANRAQPQQDEWVRARLGDKVGLIPSNYVQRAASPKHLERVASFGEL